MIDSLATSDHVSKLRKSITLSRSLCNRYPFFSSLAFRLEEYVHWRCLWSFVEDRSLEL